MQSTYKKNYLFRIFIILLSFSILLPVFANINFFPEKKQSHALNQDLNFDETKVMDDLTSASLGGSSFKLSDYPVNSAGKATVLFFVEYCYPYYANMNGKYALYVYIYNPAKLKLSEDTGQNKIQLNIFFQSDWTADGYENFQLKFLDKSDGAYYRLFYKYRVIDDGTIFNSVRSYADKNSGKRVYHVGGVYLLNTDGQSQTADNYAVGKSFSYSGFAEGWGMNKSEDTFSLSSSVQDLDVISPDVQHTYFRTGISTGLGHQWQLSSVYFGVDNSIYNKYDYLQKIKAEWWEYKTSDIIITKNSSFKNKAFDYRGVSIPRGSFNNDIGYGLAENPVIIDVAGRQCDWGWNLGSWYTSSNYSNYIYYLFERNFTYQAGNPGTVVLSSKDLLDYIYKYNKSYNTGYLTLEKNGRRLSNDLFVSGVDSERIKGYNNPEISAADINLNDMITYQPGEHSYWDNMKIYGWWKALWGSMDTSPSYANKPPIVIVTANDLKGTDNEISENLLIAPSEVQGLKDYFNDPKRKNQTVVLFHFATTDYYSSYLSIVSSSGSLINNETIRAQETVFLDFNIIHLRFVKDSQSFVIPVSMKPIDIAGPITNPVVSDDSGCGDILNIIIIIGIILIVLAFIVYFSPALPYVVDGAVAVVKLPFKAVKSVVTAFKNDKYKKQQKQNSKKYKRKYKR